jgi:hypothetical protein
MIAHGEGGVPTGRFGAGATRRAAGAPGAAKPAAPDGRPPATGLSRRRALRQHDLGRHAFLEDDHDAAAPPAGRRTLTASPSPLRRPRKIPAVHSDPARTYQVGEADAAPQGTPFTQRAATICSGWRVVAVAPCQWRASTDYIAPPPATSGRPVAGRRWARSVDARRLVSGERLACSTARQVLTGTMLEIGETASSPIFGSIEAMVVGLGHPTYPIVSTCCIRAAPRGRTSPKPGYNSAKPERNTRR